MNQLKFDEEAWKLARELAWEVYGLTSRGDVAANHRLKNDIRRASFSIMANVGEGFERGGTAEFCRYLTSACDDIADLREQLTKAVELRYIKQNSLTSIETMLEQLECMINSMLMGLGQSAIHMVSGTYQNN